MVTVSDAWSSSVATLLLGAEFGFALVGGGDLRGVVDAHAKQVAVVRDDERNVDRFGCAHGHCAQGAGHVHATHRTRFAAVAARDAYVGRVYCHARGQAREHVSHSHARRPERSRVGDRDAINDACCGPYLGDRIGLIHRFAE